MAWEKPTIKKIKPDIKNAMIYLVGESKFGKTTLFYQTILEKYGDPSKGLLICCGLEKGDRILDGVNSTHVRSWNDILEMTEWLINKKGIEHDIEMVCFDTVDELIPLAEDRTVKMSKKMNPEKDCKSILAAMGGFRAGFEYSANKVIKPLMVKLQEAGFGVWCIGHSDYRKTKNRGAMDDEGYMQLTSDIKKEYEAAFSNIFDINLMGVIDREIEDVEYMSNDKVVKKRVVKNQSRKLYFRETPSIKAGGRFSDHSDIPLYMDIVSKQNNAKRFIEIVEDGMEKSKRKYWNFEESTPTEETPEAEEERVEPIEIVSDDLPESFEDDSEEEIIEDEEENNYPEDLEEVIKDYFKNCKDAELKKTVRDTIKAHGKSLKDCPEEVLKNLYDLFAEE